MAYKFRADGVEGSGLKPEIPVRESVIKGEDSACAGKMLGTFFLELGSICEMKRRCSVLFRGASAVVAVLGLLSCSVDDVINTMLPLH